MPAEAQRLERPVGRRDRRLMAAVAAAGVLFAAGGAVFAAHSGSSSAGPRCISVAAAGVMGGGDWHYCGDAAAAYCRTHSVSACDGLVAAVVTRPRR